MIQLKNACKVYDSRTSGRVHALRNVNLTIKDGEFVFIVGPSGAGKSTLLSLLLRIEKLSSGTITVDGQDIAKIKNRKIPDYRARFGVEFQDHKLFEKSTVYENVAFAMRAIGTPKSKIRPRVYRLLDILNLNDRADHFPAQLSGGEKQRVALARAIANNPRVLIADEPTANIDPNMSADVMRMLIQLCNPSRTVIVVTHDLKLVQKLGQRVIRIEDGEIVSDTPAVDTSVKAVAKNA